MISSPQTRANAILVATHEKDVGADLVIRHLVKVNANFIRIDTDTLGAPRRHFGFYNGSSFLQYDDSIVRTDGVKAVWARRFVRPRVVESAAPEYRGFVTRELLDVMESFLDTVKAPCMNPFEADRKSGNRLLQSIVANAAGFAVPTTLVTQDADRAKAFLNQHDNAITKAISYGVVSADQDQVAHTSRIELKSDFAGLAGCPSLIQAEVKKKHEWRVTTVGQRVFSARTRRDADVDKLDWRRSNDVSRIFEKAELPRDVADKLLLVCNRSEISFGAHDLIEAKNGDFYFLETNPAGQWGWLEIELGLPIGEAIASWLMSAGRPV